MSWLPHLVQKFLNTIFKSRDNSNGDAVKPFLEHLEDLRWTLFKMVFVLIAGTGISFAYIEDITRIIKEPFEKTVPGGKLIVIGVLEPFMVSLKLAFYTGIAVAFPILLYFAAEFVLPALTKKEKRVLFPSLGAGFVLFGGGAWLAYQYILPATLKWFYDYAVKMGIDPSWQASEYYGFVTHLTIACGLLSELPVVVLGLAGLGMITSAFLRNTRTYAYMLIIVLVAIISPLPDPLSFVLASLPVLGIYEGCIWLVWLLERRRPLEDELTKEYSD